MRETRRMTDRLKNALGGLSLVATLLLMSPGVRVVRADDAEPSSVVSPPAVVPTASTTPTTTPPTTPTTPKTPTTAEGEFGPPAGSNEFIGLNTRGYNYRPESPTVSPQMVRDVLKAEDRNVPSPAPPSPSTAPR